jgi:hypothetical protein
MLRPTLLVLAISCAITSAGYAQQPGATQTPPAAKQAEPASASTTTEETAPATNVPMSEPVLTLKGACPEKNGAAPKGCVSSLTREQFEKLTNALQPPDRGPVPPEVKRRFATQYAKLLVLADAARELGLESDPKVQEIFAFAHNQIMAEALNEHYKDQYAHPSEQEIQAYYDKNVKDYQEVTLQRIIIPVMQNSPSKPKPSAEDQKAFADKIRERWVAGEAPDKLEKESMEHAGMTTSSPDVNVGARRPGSLPQAHDAVFSLKAGEISEVYSDPAAFYIYKVVSERQVPLSEVKTQISQTLERQMFNDKIQEVQAAVTPVLNDAYFGPEPPANAGPPMRPGMRGMPGQRPGPPGAGAPAPPPAQNAGASSK